jgi:hypothetical protein
MVKRKKKEVFANILVNFTGIFLILFCIGNKRAEIQNPLRQQSEKTQHSNAYLQPIVWSDLGQT